MFGSYGDRRSRTKDPGPIARPGVERAKGKVGFREGAWSAKGVKRRKGGRGQRTPRFLLWGGEAEGATFLQQDVTVARYRVYSRVVEHGTGINRIVREQEGKESEARYRLVVSRSNHRCALTRRDDFPLTWLPFLYPIRSRTRRHP